MATFVLVHGAYHGAWCWRRVTQRLRALGHQAHELTHTGSGDRAHLKHPGIDLETYAQDICALLDHEELSDVVLVGHSFGGQTVTLAADRRPDRLRHLVYLDAVLPLPGQESMPDTLPPEHWQAMVARGVEVDGVPCFAPPEPAFFGVTNAEDQAWVQRRMTPMPISLMASRPRLSHPIGNGLPATYLRCMAPAMAFFQSAWDHAGAQGWHREELQAGHDAMVSHPEEVVGLLVQVAPR